MSLVGLPARAAAAVLGLALFAGGCVTNDLSLSIVRFIPPDSSGGTCMYDTSVMDSLARGTYDVVAAGLFGAGYTAAFVIQNNLLEVMGAPIEEQAYYVDSYNVELEVEGALTTVIPANARSYNYSNGSVRLAPGDKTVGFAQIIGPALIGAVATINSDNPGTIIAHIQPVVTRAEEQHVGAFATFPVDFCVGCLLGTTMLPDCPLMITTPLDGNSCNPAADLPITCCSQGSGAEPLCGQNVLPQS